MDSSVIAVQVINYFLNTNNLKPVMEFGLDDSYFPGYEEEFNYIRKHYDQSLILDGKGVVPDKVAFAYDFPDFPLFETGDSINTMHRELLEQKLYNQYVVALQQGAEASKTSSFEAIEKTKQDMERLSRLANSTISAGKDIARNAHERYEEYLRRVGCQGLIGISTGLEPMDNDLHGWLDEDFVVITARSNVGKSWILLYHLIEAWKQGKKVGLYSGEMSYIMMGFRFDSFYKHFGNKGLISGNVVLGDPANAEVGQKSMTEYKNYIDNLIAGNLPEFKIFTQKDLGGKMNIDKLKVLQDKHDFDIWGLDQLTLMEDVKKARERRFQLSNISEGLFTCTEEFQKPIITAHQANRVAAQRKSKDPDANPELEDLSESDAIGQNATRVITLSQTENGAKVFVPKNRYGEKDLEYLTIWNINYGIYKSINTQNVKDNLF